MNNSMSESLLRSKKNYFSGRISVADPLDEIKRSQFKDQTNKFKIDNSITPQKELKKKMTWLT